MMLGFGERIMFLIGLLFGFVMGGDCRVFQKDLISREALQNAFKSECVGECRICEHFTYFKDDDGKVRTHCMLIDNAPTIDAVPMVRCGECAHRGLPACPMCHDESYYDEDDGTEYYTVDKTDDNGFCHLGARMDEEADE